jgi:two-component system, response regulator YesN
VFRKSQYPADKMTDSENEALIHKSNCVLHNDAAILDRTYRVYYNYIIPDIMQTRQKMKIRRSTLPGRNFGRYRKRILFTSLILSSLIILVTTLIGSSIYLSDITAELTNTFSAVSSTNSQYINLINDEVSFLLLDVYSDPTVISFLNLRNDDPFTEYGMARRLQSIKAVYPFIQSIDLYNATADRIVGTDINPGSTADFTDASLSAILRGEFKNRITVLARKSVVSGYIITYILLTPKPDSKMAESAVVINAYESQFIKARPEAANGSYLSFIVDQNGFVVSHTDKNEISKDYSDSEFIQKMLHDSNESSTGRCDFAGNAYVYSYSSISNINWKQVDLAPLNHIMARAAATQERIVIISALILLTSLLISGFISEYVYRPVSKFIKTVSSDKNAIHYTSKMNEIDYLSMNYSDILEKASTLQRQNQINTNLLRNEFLKSLVTEDLNLDYARKQAEVFRIPISNPNIRLLLLDVDKYYREKDLYVSSNHEYSILEIIGKVFGQNDNTYIFPVTSWRFCVMINNPADADGFDLDKVIVLSDKVQSAIRALFGYSISIAVSDAITDISGIPSAYQQAVRIMKYKTLLGLGKILTQAMINERVNTRRIYSEETNTAILNSFNSDKNALFQDRIDKFLLSLSLCNYEDFRSSVIEAGTSCIRQVEKISQDTGNAFLQNSGVCIEKLLYLESLDEIKQWFLALYDQYHLIINDIALLKNTHDNTQKIIEKAINYIHQHFMSGDLSVESIADVIGYSANYFSKAFRKVTGMKILDYISGVRMEEAQRLLKETNLSISDVAIQSGFININYFYFAFKKTTGMTPDNYRFMSRL